MELKDLEISLTSAFEYGIILGKEKAYKDLSIFATTVGDTSLLRYVEAKLQELHNDREIFEIKKELQNVKSV